MPPAVPYRLVLATTLLATTLPVLSTEEPTTLAPVVVTTETLSEKQDRTGLTEHTPHTPRAGSVLSQEELQRVMFVDSVNELLGRIPGTSLTRNMRIPIGGRSYTGNLIDGQAVKSPHQLGTWGFIEEVNTWDIERVEITRGPGSVLNSSNAVGGTINVITRDPPRVGEHRLWLQGGEYGLLRGGVSTGGTLDNGLGFLLDANQMHDKGWREDSTRKRQAASGKLVTRPGPNTRLQLRLEHLETYSEDPGNLSEAAFKQDWRQTAITHDTLSDEMRHLTPSLRLDHHFDEQRSLRVGLVHRDSTGTQVTQGFGQSAGAALRQTEKDYEENNLQLIYRQDFTPLEGKLYLGADLIRGSKRDDTYNRIDAQREDLSSASTIKEVGDSPFIQYEFSATQRLRLTLGSRYEQYSLEVDRLSFDRDGNPVEHEGKKTYRELVNKGGLVFELNPQHRLWANLAEGFLVPNTSATVTATYPNPDLPPEEMLTAELGLRGAFPAQGLGYDLTLYQTTIDNYGLTIPCSEQPERCDGYSPPPPHITDRASFTDAAGKARFRGVELALAWQAHQQLDLALSYTHARNELIDYVSRGTDYSGNRLNASPLHRLNARATYSPLPAWQVELEADYIDRYYTDLDNTDQYKRPNLYHLRSNYHWQGWDFSLQLLNLLNTRYSPRVSMSGDERIYNAGYSARLLRAGVSYQW